MWWGQRHMSDAERQQEIRRLERKRDSMLEQAPGHYHFRRVLAPAILALVVTVILFPLCRNLWHQNQQHSLWIVLFVGVMLVIFVIQFRKLSSNPPVPGDRWAYSD